MPVKTRLSHTIIVRALGLLSILYMPSELERELRIPARTVREWLDISNSRYEC